MYDHKPPLKFRMSSSFAHACACKHTLHRQRLLLGLHRGWVWDTQGLGCSLSSVHTHLLPSFILFTVGGVHFSLHQAGLRLAWSRRAVVGFRVCGHLSVWGRALACWRAACTELLKYQSHVTQSTYTGFSTLRWRGYRGCMHRGPIALEGGCPHGEPGGAGPSCRSKARCTHVGCGGLRTPHPLNVSGTAF